MYTLDRYFETHIRKKVFVVKRGENRTFFGCFIFGSYHNAIKFLTFQKVLLKVVLRNM